MVTLTLYDVETGYLRDIEQADMWFGLLDYQWTDGNYGCDCNRGQFLYGRRAGEGEGKCGSSRYHLTVFGSGAPKGSQ
jgi:hypothetical protein